MSASPTEPISARATSDVSWNEPDLCTEERMAGLLAAFQSLPSAPKLVDALAQAAEQLEALVPFDNLAVLLLDDQKGDLRCVYSIGYPEDLAQGWRLGTDQGLVGAAAREAKSVLVEDVTTDDRYVSKAPGTRTELVLPMFGQGSLIGILDIGMLQCCQIEESRVQLLQRLANALGLSIENRRLQKGLREQTRLMELLHEIGRELSSVLDRRLVLERMADRLKSLIDHDVFSVYLWNDDRELLEPWVSVSFDKRRESPLSLRLGEGISGSAAALRQPLRIGNVALDPRHLVCDPSFEIRSELAVPLVFEGRLIGVLDLESTHDDAFRLEHERVLSTLGSSLAIALVNAEMYERLEQEQHRLDRELQAARQVQKRLLPQSTPWISGMQIAVESETARHLGGDFYDFLRYDDGRIAIAVGDVAGKSTSAALYGALSVGHLREIAGHHQPQPRRMLELLNQKLREIEIGRVFVALTYLTFDPQTKTITLANAGLPYAVLMQGGEPTELLNGGIPVGSLALPKYQESHVELVAGDSLVLLSDGFAEGRNSQGQEFGQDRIEQSLRRLDGECIDQVASGLLEDLREFCGAEVSDDRTVVVLKAVVGD